MGLEEHLRRISDELEIRNLIAQLAQRADDANLDEYAALYSEDAIWDGGPKFGIRNGVADIVAYARERRAAGVSGPGSHTRHVVTTISMQITGDTAAVRSYFLFFVDCDSAPVVRVAGHYDDEMRRTSSGWKLARRAVHPG